MWSNGLQQLACDVQPVPGTSCQPVVLPLVLLEISPAFAGTASLHEASTATLSINYLTLADTHQLPDKPNVLN
jgi:hypothetical protein